MTLPPLWNPSLPIDPEEVNLPTIPQQEVYVRQPSPPRPTVIALPTELDLVSITIRASISTTDKVIFIPQSGHWAVRAWFTKGSGAPLSAWVYRTADGWEEVPPHILSYINDAFK